MSTVQLTDENFQATIDKGGIVFVDFWAEWCGPCRMFAPVYERTSKDHPDIVFGKLETDDNPRTASAWQIQAIPTLMIFRDGIPLFANPGVLPQTALEDLIRQVRALDMDDVRKKIAAEAASRKGAKRAKGSKASAIS
jgi:thioredoxin 1